MKTIYCYKCGAKVGEILKGNWKRGAKGVCKDCLNALNTLSNRGDVKDFLQGLSKL